MDYRQSLLLGLVISIDQMSVQRLVEIGRTSGEHPFNIWPRSTQHLAQIWPTYVQISVNSWRRGHWFSDELRKIRNYEKALETYTNIYEHIRMMLVFMGII